MRIIRDSFAVGASWPWPQGHRGPREAKSLILKGFLVNIFTNFFANPLFLKDKKLKKNDLPPLTFDERIIILIYIRSFKHD